MCVLYVYVCVYVYICTVCVCVCVCTFIVQIAINNVIVAPLVFWHWDEKFHDICSICQLSRSSGICVCFCLCVQIWLNHCTCIRANLENSLFSVNCMRI